MADKKKEKTVMNGGDTAAASKSKMTSKPAAANLTDIDFDVDDVLRGAGGEGAKKGNNKKLSVERIYQKKTQHEHILLRPDTYIGSIEKVTTVNE